MSAVAEVHVAAAVIAVAGQLVEQVGQARIRGDESMWVFRCPGLPIHHPSLTLNTVIRNAAADDEW